MRFFLSILLIFINSWATAQAIQYYTKEGKRTNDKSMAQSYDEVFTTDSTTARVKSYDITGRLESDLHYSDLRKNILHGNAKSFHENGQLWWNRTFNQGKIEGLSEMHYKNGQLKRSEVYKNGEVINGKLFTQTGQDTVYFLFEVQPQYPGGPEAMFKYLRTNVKYPKSAKKSKIQGKVICQFVIDHNGKTVEIAIKESVHPDLDNEVIRLISEMPLWSPGMQDGKKVKVRYTLPIKFTL